MDQGPNIRRVAQQMVRSMGVDAYAYLCDHAEMARLNGDRESAITWWDIALAVAEMEDGPAKATTNTSQFL